MDSIKIIVTGGTIDDISYTKEEDAPTNHQSLIPNLLKQSIISPEYSVEILMQKDSRVVNDTDREIIFNYCKNCLEDKIIITHGTFTMPETALYLGDKKLSKTIILFGAAIPGNKENSDALFNLGAAFIATQLLPKGVYVVMNGKVFDYENVKKNLLTGNFEEK